VDAGDRRLVERLLQRDPAARHADGAHALGRIVTITSVAALLGNRGQANYAAAKGALHAATRSLAREIGNRGITVNCVAPGIIDTPMSAAAFDAEAIARLVPLQRAGSPEDVAGVVGFLASDAAGYVTGQVLPIDGGMT